jgi:putative aldouronate transport system substrate-binding protein
MGVYDADTFYQFIDNGLVRDIPEEMLMSRPNIKQMLEYNPVYKEFMVDGKIYSLPHTYWRTQEEDWKGGVTWARKDWREKLGLDVPKTLEDWTEMMDAFANQDPDGNGKKDTYGITYFKEEIPTFIFNAHGAYIEEWVEEDGKWVHGTYTQNAHEAVKYSKDLFDRGILDPEYVVMKEVGQVLDKFVTGKAGVMVYGTMPNEIKDVYEHFETANPGQKADDCLEILLYPTSPDGTVKNSAAFNWFSDVEFSADTTDEQLNKILDIFDWTLSEEGDRITRYGFEGEDYKIENGKVVSLLGKNEDGTDKTIVQKYPTSDIGLYYCQKSTEQFMESTVEQKYVDLSFAAKEMYKGTGLENTINWKAKFIYTPAKSKLNPLAAFRIAANKLIISGQDVDVDAELDNFWNEFDKEYEAFKAFDELTEAMKK